MDVALLTCAAHPEGLREDRALVAALDRRDIDARPVVWGGADPRGARLSVVRGVWDYVERAPEFLDWLRARDERIANPVPVVEWNHHKRYLADLARRGCRVVPTGFVPEGEVVEVTGVVKPAIGSGARGARRVEREEIVAMQDLIVQPFLPAVEVQGEISLVFFAGAFSHAVRKRPAPGGWLVQAEHGGSVEPYEPDEDERAVAFVALSGIDHLYARVDLVRDLAGKPAVIELELIEPELFLDHDPAAADRFASAIEAQCRE